MWLGALYQWEEGEYKAMQMLCSDQCCEILLHGISDLNRNRCTGATGFFFNQLRLSVDLSTVGWLHSSGSTFSISIILRQVVDSIKLQAKIICSTLKSQRNDDGTLIELMTWTFFTAHDARS